MTRLALFDLDGTLIDDMDAYRRWAKDFADRYGMTDDDLSWFHSEDVWSNSALRERLDETRERFGLDDDLQALWDGFLADFPSYVRCAPETFAGLSRLRDAGWTIGIVTNGRTGHQSEKITQAGIDAYVDAWVVSEAVGVHKPEIGIFTAIADKLGVSLADGGWMVGDLLAADIAGGRAAGLSTIWIQRPQPRGADDPRPTHTVDSCAAAIELMLR